VGNLVPRAIAKTKTAHDSIFQYKAYKASRVYKAEQDSKTHYGTRYTTALYGPDPLHLGAHQQVTEYPIMARLSGPPVEQHKESSADAPRRRRGRPARQHNDSHTDDQDVALLGKRHASPTAYSPQTKRSKHVDMDGNVESDANSEDDEDQLAAEWQQSVSRVRHGDTMHGGTIHVASQSSHTTATTPRHSKRRQSEPPVGRYVDSSDNDAAAHSPLPVTEPVPGLTPHLKRVGASRTRFTNARRARMSMPASFDPAPLGDVDAIDATHATHVQFVPLKAALDGRTRRRLRRSHLSQELLDIEGHQKQDKKLLLDLRRQLKAADQKIQELEFRLEARRLGDIDITDEHARELESELAEARNEINDLRASSLYNGDDQAMDALSDEDDDHNDNINSSHDSDDLLLVNPAELDFSQDLIMEQTPNGKYASRVHELSQSVTLESFPRITQLSHDTLVQSDDVAIPDGLEDRAVERYERELAQYSRALGESQGALRVVTLELQNLHYINAGASANVILTELRHGFENLRPELEKFVPGSTRGMTNQELLHKIPELFGGIFMELKEKITLITASQRSEVLLRRQFEGVLDLLGESEDRVTSLEKNVHDLDKSNESKQRTLLDLDNKHSALTSLTAEQHVQLVENGAEIDRLRGENVDKDNTLARLHDALDQCRVELHSVSTAATLFEKEHHGMIERMEREHSLAIQSLEAERVAEQDGRELAEADALQKQKHINHLEAGVERMETEVDAFTLDLAKLRERLATEQEGRHMVERERDEQTDLAYQHANTIENLHETILELREHLAEFRTNLSAERAQREKTETELDEANEKIDDLNVRLHDNGLQANELRSKLFQLQQEKEEAIATMEEEVRERVADLTEQLTLETETRVAAEETIARLEQQKADTQSNLVFVETSLAKMTRARADAEQDRDVQISKLTNQYADLQNKYAALDNSTSSTITSLQANITDLNNQVLRQQAEIKRLNEQIVEADNVHLEETTILEEKIVDLESDLAKEKADNASYRKENDSLSKRVESEANELLNIVDAHKDEVVSLNTVIATQAATIKNLEAASLKRKQEYEELVEEHTREIMELTLQGDDRAENITLLELQVEKLKEQFRLAEEDTRETTDALMRSHRALQDQNEALAEKLKERNAAALAAVQEMKIKRIEVRTQGIDLNRVIAGKVTKTSERVKVAKKSAGKSKATKRQWDSGFGIDENVEDEDGAQDPVLA